MSTFSLLSAINVCKVNTGYADKIQSDRYEDPKNMLCPLWNGQDSVGRVVCPDSYYTKAPGCASANDRVSVENDLRPRYFEYVGLDAYGLNAPMSQNAADRQRKGEFNKITGNFGFNYDSTNTQRDNMVTGASGQMASGCNQRHLNNNNNVFDNQGKLNLQARQAQSAKAAEQAQAARNQSGFRSA
jgi:hypothetical protein